MDPEQTAPIYRSSLIWVHTVCHRGLLNILADKNFVAIGALRVKSVLQVKPNIQMSNFRPGSIKYYPLPVLVFTGNRLFETQGGLRFKKKVVKTKVDYFPPFLMCQSQTLMV